MIQMYVGKFRRNVLNKDQHNLNIVMNGPMYRSIEFFAANNDRSFNNEVLIRLARTLYDDEQNYK